MPDRAPTRFHTLVLPAIIAQSMIIGGGYATGREVVEYAGRFGNRGWLSVAIITVCFAVVMAPSFELARLAGAYDYKTWSRNLVGPLWWLVDLLILSMMMLVIAVMTAAIGEVLQQTVGLPKLLSLALALVCVGFLSWRGSGFIEKAKTWGSAALYLGYCAFAVLVLTAPVEGVVEAATATEAAATVRAASAPATEGGVLEVIVAAVLYVAYNVAVVPAVLFCLHRQTRRSETFSSGALAGVAMTVPFALTLACLLRSPQASVMEAEVPWLPMIGAAADGRAGGAALWIAIFGLVAGWTLIETDEEVLGRRHRVEPSGASEPQPRSKRSGGQQQGRERSDEHPPQGRRRALAGEPAAMAAEPRHRGLPLRLGRAGGGAIGRCRRLSGPRAGHAVDRRQDPRKELRLDLAQSTDHVVQRGATTVGIPVERRREHRLESSRRASGKGAGQVQGLDGYGSFHRAVSVGQEGQLPRRELIEHDAQRPHVVRGAERRRGAGYRGLDAIDLLGREVGRGPQARRFDRLDGHRQRHRSQARRRQQTDPAAVQQLDVRRTQAAVDHAGPVQNPQ